MNTKNKGQIRLMVFKKKGAHKWTGVCLDFGIVIENRDQKKVIDELKQGAIGYLNVIRKENLDEALLNNQAEKFYFDLFENYLEEQIQKNKKSRPISENYPSFSINFFTPSQLLKSPAYA